MRPVSNRTSLGASPSPPPMNRDPMELPSRAIVRVPPTRSARPSETVRVPAPSLPTASPPVGVQADPAPDTVTTATPTGGPGVGREDRKRTRLNSSHVKISYADGRYKQKSVDE